MRQFPLGHYCTGKTGRKSYAAPVCSSASLAVADAVLLAISATFTVRRIEIKRRSLQNDAKSRSHVSLHVGVA